MIFRLFLFFIGLYLARKVYRWFRGFIHILERDMQRGGVGSGHSATSPSSTASASSSAAGRGEKVIEAEYRVISNKDRSHRF